MSMYFRIFVYVFLLANVIACKSDQMDLSKTSFIEEQEAIDRGKSITQNTFTVLSSELKQSMSEGGIENAINYCNINALPITAQLSKENNAIIKRTSLKVRNPKNAPSDQEEMVLREFEKMMDSGKPLTNKVMQNEQMTMFYAPIITQELCLKCHGAKSDIAEYDFILSKYPNDKAIGFSTGDLRGMWSVALLPDSKNKK